MKCLVKESKGGDEGKLVRKGRVMALFIPGLFWLAIIEFYLIVLCSPLYITFQECMPKKSIYLPGRANFDSQKLELDC